MLSYSPRQIVRGLAQRALMPLIFSDLAVNLFSGEGERSGAIGGGGERAVSAGAGADVYDKIGGTRR